MLVHHSVIVLRVSMNSSKMRQVIRNSRLTRKIASIAKPVISKTLPKILTGLYPKVAEVRITLICKLGFSSIILAALLGSPAIAKRGDDADMLKKYVEARLAESTDQPAVAAAIYAETLRQ